MTKYDYTKNMKLKEIDTTRKKNVEIIVGNMFNVAFDHQNEIVIIHNFANNFTPHFFILPDKEVSSLKAKSYSTNNCLNIC